MKLVAIEHDTHSGRKDRIVCRETDQCPVCGKPEADHCWQDKATRRWVWSACNEALLERAAIREYDGGHPRAEAERLALEDIKKREYQP